MSLPPLTPGGDVGQVQFKRNNSVLGGTNVYTDGNTYFRIGMPLEISPVYIDFLLNPINREFPQRIGAFNGIIQNFQNRTVSIHLQGYYIVSTTNPFANALATGLVGASSTLSMSYQNYSGSLGTMSIALSKNPADNSTTIQLTNQVPSFSTYSIWIFGNGDGVPTPPLAYTVQGLPSGIGDKTGVAYMNLPPFERPILLVSNGRKNIGNCYAQLPVGNTGYGPAIDIVSGAFTGASVSGDLVLFSGGSGPDGETASQIYRISPTGTATLLWTDPNGAGRLIRVGTFVKGSMDFLLGGALKTTPASNQTFAVYYQFDGTTWNQLWTSSTPNSVGATAPPFTVSIAATPQIILLGNRINNTSFRNNQNLAISSQNYTTSTNVTTNLQATGVYVGDIIPGDGIDFVFVGNGFRNDGQSPPEIPAQCFILRPNNTRINLGTPISARSVDAFDFTGNGLLDIFICCMTEPHQLFLQTSPGIFVQQSIVNTITQQPGGEARSLTIGHLYNNPETVEVVITTFADQENNQIYSFQRPVPI